MKKMLAILLALALLLALCACGESKSEAPAATQAPAAEKAGETGSAALPEKPADAQGEKSAAAAPSEAPVKAAGPEGYYKATESIGADGKREDMSELEALGMAYYLVLEADGTGYMEMLGEKTPLQWSGSTITDDEGNASGFHYADDQIMLEGESSKMIFVRLTDEQLADYQENGSGSIEDILGGLIDLFGSGADDTVYVETEGMIGDYAVRFVGAEALKDADGKDALRVWYDFTNQSAEVVTAGTLNIDAEQGEDADYMAWTYVDSEVSVPEDETDYLAVAPGYTVRCAMLRSFDPAGGEIAIKAYNWDGEGVVYHLDPANLPGAPADEFVIGATPDTEVAYMFDVAESDDAVELLGIERVKDWDDEDAVLVRFRFTNTGDEATSFGMARDTYALQDGYGLESAVYMDGAEEEQENTWTDIAPGESVEVAMAFLLRTDSPVVVTSKDSFLNESYIGAVYALP